MQYAFGKKECLILKKRFLAGLMALCCILSFSACNNTNGDKTGSTSNNAESQSGGIIDDAGDVVEDAGDAVDDAGDDVSSGAQNAVDDIKENMSSNNNDRND